MSLAPLGLPSCFLHPSIAMLSFFVAGSTGLDSGYTCHDFHLPIASAFGVGIDAQWLVVSPSLGLGGVSEALRFAITATN